jgi:hypothetical protein
MAVPDALLAAERVPHVAPLQPEPDRVQVTPLFALSLFTVAVNGWVNPTCTVAVVSKRLTEIPAVAGVTVIAAAPVFVGSVTEVAVSVIAGGVGAFAGAV